MDPKIELAKPRDFGEIINDTFTFIRQNFKPLLKYFFIFCGFFILATAATSVLNQINMFRSVNNFNPNSFDNDSAFGRVSSILTPVYFLNLTFLLLTYSSITVMVLSYMALYKQNRNLTPTTEEMWGYIKYFFLKALGSSILIGLLVGVGLVFCIIPGIYLYPAMALVLPIMVIENTSFSYAFNQSFRLIKDNWWLIFGALIVIFIVYYVASLVVLVPASLLTMGSLFFHFNKGTSLTAIVITTILQSIVHIFHVLSIVGACICYFSLTENKEGTGLIERINQFGTSTPDPNITPEEY
jgi:hypothetical protein